MPFDFGIGGRKEAGGFIGKAETLASQFDEQGRTALSLAIKEEREDIVELLLNLSADPDKSEDMDQAGLSVMIPLPTR